MQNSTVALWLTLVLAGTVANEIWRTSGVFLSRGIDPDSPVLVWVKDVSTALVAALVARLLLHPIGALATIDGAVRAIAFLVGVVAYLLSRRNLVIGLASAEAAFFAAIFILHAQD